MRRCRSKRKPRPPVGVRSLPEDQTLVEGRLRRELNEADPAFFPPRYERA